MPKWPWIERKFNFDYPAGKFPDVLERLRGTPARVEERVVGLDPVLLTRRDDVGWSIQENIGHLADVEPLFMGRIEEVLAGQPTMTAADMSNVKSNQADHNAKPIDTVLKAFRDVRGQLVARLERLNESDWSRAAHHPRLDQPMRIVDLAYFLSEHDDYHLARITELIRTHG